MKKVIVIIMSLFLVFALCSCGAKPQTTLKCLCGASSHTTKGTAAPTDFTGTWKQINSASEDSWQAATIKGSTITVNWISDNGDTKSLYWAGSFKAPAKAVDVYAWTSKNDKEKTGGALLASSDDTKEFAYQDGVISYKVSALGTTTTVKLKKE